MKYCLTQRQELIANKVAHIPGMKRLLSVPYNAYKRLLIFLRTRNFHKHATDMLAHFDKCMTDNGYPYALAFGSMLGAIREHGFIKHDMDVDVTVWYSDKDDKMMEMLTSNGFRLRHSFEVENGRLGREDTIVWKDVSLDIYYLYPPIETMPYCSGSWERIDGSTNLVDSMKKFGRIQSKRIDMPISKETRRVPFENMRLPVPANAEEFLEFFYGKTYMTPNPQWKDADSSAKRIPWETDNITYHEWEG